MIKNWCRDKVLHRVQTFDAVVDESAPDWLKEKFSRIGLIKTTTHTPPYMMHKFWARRPWRVFRELINEFTRPGDIILDPFAGGGVTLVEGLIARRRVVAVDLNPLAVKIMRHEAAPLDAQLFRDAVGRLSYIMEPLASTAYAVRCPNCRERAVAIWTEYEASTEKPLRIQYECRSCGSKGLKLPTEDDLPELRPPPQVPKVRIQPGDKTSDLLESSIVFFDQLFTGRNLYMILKLKEEIEKMEVYGDNVKSFLLFTLSSTLKWASKMSHLRGDIVEGWALHAYWIYPKYLEINVWRQFLNRAGAVVRGKEFTNKYIGPYAREARTFEELASGATYMVLCADSRKLPLREGVVDAVITDPPYGDNVNYAELSDYFLWLFGESAPKREEIIINRTRGFTIHHYAQGLEEVFKECYRVLRPGGLLISTFNSKDALVVGAFVYSLKRAGFSFAAAIPQPYLRAYETTFHALQVDSMPYDYVFFFYKGSSGGTNAGPPDPDDLYKHLAGELKACREAMCTEREYRMRVYPKLIKFFAQADSMSTIISASRALESIVEGNMNYFKMMREKRIEARRERKQKTGGRDG
jgi:putative DNA methylase